jgi:hypothetical protein
MKDELKEELWNMGSWVHGFMSSRVHGFMGS